MVELPLGRALSWYPRASMGLGAQWSDEGYGAARSRWSSVELYVGLYAPLLVHVASHFFVGFGPFVQRDLSNAFTPGGLQQQFPESYFGASLVVGGWL